MRALYLTGETQHYFAFSTVIPMGIFVLPLRVFFERSYMGKSGYRSRKC